MKKTYIKSTFIDIKKSFGRFASIFAISAIGVGFLVGLLSATPATKHSISDYYHNENMYDIKIVSPTGFNDKYLQEINLLPEVKDTALTFETDLMTTNRGQSLASKLLTHDFFNNNVSKLTLVEGRFPQAPDETVVIEKTIYIKDIAVGENIFLNNAPYFNTSTLKVVGIVKSPEFFYKEKTPSPLGGGVLEAIIFVNSSLLAQKMSTTLSLTLSSTSNLDCYSSRYSDIVTRVKESISQLSVSEETAKYLLTRSENVSYVMVKLNSDKISAIAVIFPIFFFLVALLVTLTTMTRMIEEERLIIGTFKALGFSKATITFKYLNYSFLASFSGALIGIVFGFGLLPLVLYNTFNSLFYLPEFKVIAEWLSIVLSSLGLIFCALLATYVALSAELKEKPAALLRPKAPKKGKRILLERVGFIWNHLKFKYKSTIRNLFRYKKHFIMTIVGIAGCSALLTAAFGLNDSLDDITHSQYDNILKYQSVLSFDEEVSSQPLKDFLTSSTEVSDFNEIYSSEYYQENDSSRYDIHLFVPSSALTINDYISFNILHSSNTLEFTTTSVFLSYQVANVFNVKVGDPFTIKNTKSEALTFTVTGIYENYIDNYFIIAPDVYQDVVSSSPRNNTILIKNNLTKAQQREFSAAMIKISGVKKVEFNSNVRDTYGSLVTSIGNIVLLLIVSAGSLALVVIYNLTNINICERTRELATLKVLGYQNYEVSFYVYREILILTVLGMLGGLACGALLHYFVAINVDNPGMMFGRTVRILSYFYSMLLTLCFAFIVDFLMYFKIKKLPMVESLKSQE